MNPLIRFGFVRLLLDVQFWFPTWLILLLDHGLSFAQAALLDGLFRVVVILAEIPAGRFADKIGRKRATITTCALTTLVFGIIALANSFSLFVVAWTLWGILWALSSGIDTSYAWELARQHKPGFERRYLGITRVTTGAAGLFSLLSAGWLYTIWPPLPYCMTAALALLALALTSSLPDIHASRVLNHHSTTRQLRQALRNPTILNAVLLASIVLTVGWSPQILVQPLAVQVGLDPQTTSLVFALFAILGGLGGFLGSRLSDLERPWLIISLFILASSCTLMTVISSSGMPAIMSVLLLSVLSAAHASAKTITDIWIAEVASTHVLASVFSLVSLFGGIAIAVARPTLLLISAEFGPQLAFVYWGIFGLVCLLPASLLLRQLRR